MKSRLMALLLVTLLLSCLMITLPQANVRAQGPTDYIAHWTFDEGTGTNAADSTENGHNGTLYDATWTPGISGSAVRFDGLRDYVGVADSPDINFGAGERFSISLWVKSTGSDGDQVLFSKRNNTGYQVHFNAGTEFFRIDEGATHTEVTFTFPFDNQWHQLVFMRDNSRASVWMDGQLHNAEPDNSLADITDPIDLSIGSEYLWGPSSITGAIDDFRIYDRALSASEVLAAYNEMILPTSPQSLTATRGNAQVTLDWQPPASDGATGITNYRIYRGTRTGNTHFIYEVGNVLTYTDTALVNGDTYFYTITAVNSQGEGQSSAEVSATPSDEPSAPINPIATAGEAQIQLNWQAPASDGGSPVLNYTVYRGTTSGATPFLTFLGNVLVYVDTGLTSGQTYFYRISATNANGEGLLSNEVSATPIGSPGAPTNLQTSSGDGYVYLSWDAPANDGGSAVTNYAVYRGTSAAGVTLLANVGNVLYYNDTGAVNGQTYYYTVSAVNGVGESAASTSASATPNAYVPPPDDDGFPIAILLLLVVLLVLIMVIILVLSRRKKAQEAPPTPPTPPPPIWAPEPTEPAAEDLEIEMGRNHLFLTGNVVQTFQTFKTILDKGNPGLCLTNRYPDKLREDFGLDNARIIWFSESATGPDIYRPQRLDFEVTKTTIQFIRDFKEPVILIDGLDYLILTNGFENVSTFLKRITDVAAMEHATLVVIVRPDALTPDRVSYLKGQFERVA